MASRSRGLRRNGPHLLLTTLIQALLIGTAVISRPATVYATHTLQPQAVGQVQPLPLDVQPMAPETQSAVDQDVFRPSMIKDLIARKAKLYGANSAVMEAVIRCENPELDPDLQSRHIEKTGKREQSFGLVQIHLPSHPEISKEQATDPDFSVEYMAREFSRGNYSQWTCWRTLKAKGKI